MLFLPRSLCALVEAASKDQTRFSMNSIKLTERPDGGFRAEATDGRKAIIVQEGYYEPNVHDLRREDIACDAAESEQISEGLIPADEFVKAFKMLPKKGTHHNDQNARLVVRMEKNQVIFVAGDTVSKSRYMEGRFPSIDGVLPKGNPFAVVQLLPEHTIDLMKAIKTLAPEKPLTLCFYPEAQNDGLIETCIGGSVISAEGLVIDTLLMPVGGMREAMERKAEEKRRKQASIDRLADTGKVKAGEPCPLPKCDGTIDSKLTCNECGYSPAGQEFGPDVDDDDQDEETDTVEEAIEWSPEILVTQVAGGIDKIMPEHFSTLMEKPENWDEGADMVIWIGQRRPDLREGLVKSFGENFILEDGEAEALAEAMEQPIAETVAAS